MPKFLGVFLKNANKGSWNEAGRDVSRYLRYQEKTNTLIELHRRGPSTELYVHTWDPITHLLGYASTVKEFKESNEKEVERLAADRRRETELKESKGASLFETCHGQHSNLRKYSAHDRSYLTSVEYRHISDGEQGILPVHETHQTHEALRDWRSTCSLHQGRHISLLTWAVRARSCQLNVT